MAMAAGSDRVSMFVLVVIALISRRGASWLENNGLNGCQLDRSDGLYCNYSELLPITVRLLRYIFYFITIFYLEMLDFVPTYNYIFFKINTIQLWCNYGKRDDRLHVTLNPLPVSPRLKLH